MSHQSGFSKSRRTSVRAPRTSPGTVPPTRRGRAATRPRCTQLKIHNKGRDQHERLMRPRAGAASHLRGTVSRQETVGSRSSKHQTGRNWALGVESVKIILSFRLSWACGCPGPRGCLKMARAGREAQYDKKNGHLPLGFEPRL